MIIISYYTFLSLIIYHTFLVILPVLAAVRWRHRFRLYRDLNRLGIHHRVTIR